MCQNLHENSPTFQRQLTQLRQTERILKRATTITDVCIKDIVCILPWPLHTCSVPWQVRVHQDKDTVLDAAQNVTQSPQWGERRLRWCHGGRRCQFVEHLAGHSRSVNFILTIGRFWATTVDFWTKESYQLIKIYKRSDYVNNRLSESKMEHRRYCSGQDEREWIPKIQGERMRYDHILDRHQLGTVFICCEAKG